MKEKHYRYHLLKYSGPNSRITCPQCGRPHCFTPYVDDNEAPADPDRYGRCDHETSCGYCEYPPYEPSEAPYVNVVRPRPVVSKPNEPCVIPDKIMKMFDLYSTSNALISFLLKMYPAEQVRRVCTMYHVGTARSGATVFFQIDSKGHCRDGKVIHYNPDTGHRIKDGRYADVTWVHRLMKNHLPADWELTQCLFGEHLLPLYTDKVIGLVESEKTALICAFVLPEYLWIATGGKHQFKDNLLVLGGRKVVAFPDIDAYDFWCQKALEYPMLNITVSDVLERNATTEMRERKVDIADVLIEHKIK